MKKSDEVVSEIKLLQANDWNLKEETPEYVIMTKNAATGTGHIFVFLFTFWFSLGIGNLVYYLLCNKKRKVMK